jgi:hypothetical protein
VLKKYCHDNNLILADEPESFYDYDKVSRLLSVKKRTIKIECKVILDIWYLSLDMARSTNISFYKDGDDMTDEILTVYNKLFYGCNLPAIKGDGENYFPIWSDEEMNIIYNILENGLRTANTCLSLSKSI